MNQNKNTNKVNDVLQTALREVFSFTSTAQHTTRLMLANKLYAIRRCVVRAQATVREIDERVEEESLRPYVINERGMNEGEPIYGIGVHSGEVESDDQEG